MTTARSSPEPAATPFPRAAVLALAAVAFGGIVTVGVLVASLGWFPSRVDGLLYGDTDLYREYTLRVLAGDVPYRDFPLAYPPLALVPFFAPHAGQLIGAGGREAYLLFSLVQNAALGALTVWAVGRAAARVAPPGGVVPATALCAVTLVLVSPLVAWRYDIFPAALTALALLFVVESRPLAAGTFVGLGIAAKLYPALLLPVLAAYYVARRDLAALRRMLIGATVTSVILLLPTVVASGGRVPAYVTHHVERGLQIESVAAGLIALGSALREAFAMPFPEAVVFHSHGSANLESSAAIGVLPWLNAALAAVVVGVSVLSALRFRSESAAGRNPDHATLAAAISAVLLASIVAAKVFSPQYVLWLLPFAVLLPRAQAVVALVISVLTIGLLWFVYDQLIALELGAVALLNLRNVLCLALLGWILVDLLPRTRARVERAHQTDAAGARPLPGAAGTT